MNIIYIEFLMKLKQQQIIKNSINSTEATATEKTY